MNRKLVTLLICCIAVVGCGLSSAIGADDKKDSKLLGKWEFVKGEGLPAGAVVEFKADGKLTIGITENGKTITLDAEYKHSGDKLLLTLKSPDGKDFTEPHTVKTLTDEKFVTIDAQGKEAEFKRKK